MSLAVVGTDTEIGKTIACAVLLARYGTHQRLAYWKPIATGSSEGRDTEVIKRLCGHPVELLDEGYLFDPPVSPHLAARWAGDTIQPQKLVAHLDAYRGSEKGHPLLVEGIGGLLVPLNDEGYLLVDLFREMDLACLLVASSRLGTINHTLLSLEALRCRDLKPAGVLLNGPSNPDNRQAIEQFGNVEVLGEIAPMDPLSQHAIIKTSHGIDREGILEPYFGKI